MSSSSRPAWASTFARVAAVLLLVSGGVALAAESEEGAKAAGAEELSAALEALAGKDFAQAAVSAFASVSKSAPGAEKHESAQFVLAEALEGLELTQAAAAYYFAVAEQRENPALLPRALAGIERLTRRGLIDEDRLLHGVLVQADVAQVSEATADFLHYYRGLASLRIGHERWKEHEFGELTPTSHYGQKARLAEIVVRVERGEIEPALELLEKLREEALDPEVQAEFVLVRARILFELRREAEAIEEYRKIRSTSQAQAGELLLERAWAHYRAGAFHDAMGLLYALAAPSNRRLFLPDQFVLRGLIYQRFCHFRAGKAALVDFRTAYGAAIDALEKGRAPHEVERLALAAGEAPLVGEAVRIQTAVERERKTLESLAGKLEEGGLTAQLTRLYALLADRAENRATRLMRPVARGQAERLLEASEQANLLEYEIGVSILRRVRGATGEIGLRTPAEPVPLGGDEVYYPFNGEFWTDELPDMRFLIQDRCVE